MLPTNLNTSSEKTYPIKNSTSKNTPRNEKKFNDLVIE